MEVLFYFRKLMPRALQRSVSESKIQKASPCVLPQGPRKQYVLCSIQLSEELTRLGCSEMGYRLKSAPVKRRYEIGSVTATDLIECSHCRRRGLGRAAAWIAWTATGLLGHSRLDCRVEENK
jgi:hypothetical protein